MSFRDFPPATQLLGIVLKFKGLKGSSYKGTLRATYMLQGHMDP